MSIEPLQNKVINYFHCKSLFL